MKMTALDILRAEYGDSKNFMTPTVLEVGMATEAVAYELSKGTGFDRQTIWGVSFVRVNEAGATVRLSSLSDCFHSEADARERIDSVKEHGTEDRS